VGSGEWGVGRKLPCDAVSVYGYNSAQYANGLGGGVAYALGEATDGTGEPVGAGGQVKSPTTVKH